MAKKLTVWGMTLFRYNHPFRSKHNQVRGVVATTSKTAAAKAFGISLYEFNNNAAKTGNAQELNLALSVPGKVFIAKLDDPVRCYMEDIK